MKVRSGMEHIYTLEPGEDWRMMANGVLVITHPDREPFLIERVGDAWVKRPLKVA